MQDKYNFVKNNEYSTRKVGVYYFYFGTESFPEELESAMPGSFRKGVMGREAGVIFLIVPGDMNPRELIRAILYLFLDPLPHALPCVISIIKPSLFMQYFFCGDFLLDPS